MRRGKWYYYIVIFFKPMIESSSFGGSLSRLRLASESRGWWNRGSGYRCEWTHEGKPNGRTGRQKRQEVSCLLRLKFLPLRGDVYRALFGARMSVRCIERRNFLCNLGGTAGTYLLSHFSGAGVFYFYRVH